MRQQRTDLAAIEAELARIRSFALDALRRRWRMMFGQTPSAGLSKDLLGRMIACRLQEQAFGGLDRESLRFLDALARHGGSRRRQLKPGTVLVRDYHGQRHTVTVTPMASTGRARPMRASPPSPAPSPARPGVVRGFSPCATKRRTLPQQQGELPRSAAMALNPRPDGTIRILLLQPALMRKPQP